MQHGSRKVVALGPMLLEVIEYKVLTGKPCGDLGSKVHHHVAREETVTN